jgi:UDP-hydrolysing UDP-N-acetyl-D-glucosamine 2-epimerase
MRNKRKICVVVTARPSYSRIKTALLAIKNHPKLELQLVIAGSALLERYGSAIKFIEKDGFTVAERVYNILEGENITAAAKTTGIGILELSTVFEKLKPHIVVTVADRFETMATAIAASYMNIPLAHIQGGEVTGNIDEKVRHSITKLSDYHFPASESAAERVHKLGEDKNTIYNTGCPSIDLASEVLKNSEIDFKLFEKYGGVGAEFSIKEDYIVVMQHPVTNEYQESKNQISETLAAIDELNIPTFWFWPNVDAGSDGTSKGIRSFREKNKLNNIHFFKNMEPTDFLKLLVNSKCLIGNSSVGIRECAYLGVPVVNIGSRQQRRDRGHNVIDVDYKSGEIKEAIIKWIKDGRPKRSLVYGGGNAGVKIADKLSEVKLKFHKTIIY